MERKLVLTLIDDGKEIQKAVAVLEHGEEVDVEEAAKAAFSKIKKAEPAFVPHLMYEEIDESLGELGTPSPFKDEEGHELFVGDVVEISRKGDTGKKYLTFVCLTEENGFILMGIGDCCNSDIGVIDDKWKVRKVRDHADVIDGEIHAHVVCVRDPSNIGKVRKPHIGTILAAMLSAVVETE